VQQEKPEKQGFPESPQDSEGRAAPHFLEPSVWREHEAEQHSKFPLHGAPSSRQETHFRERGEQASSAQQSD